MFACGYLSLTYNTVPLTLLLRILSIMLCFRFQMLPQSCQCTGTVFETQCIQKLYKKFQTNLLVICSVPGHKIMFLYTVFLSESNTQFIHFLKHPV